MSFSAEWEQRYAANTHLSIWPWSDVVSLTRRHHPTLGPGVCPEVGRLGRVLCCERA